MKVSHMDEKTFSCMRCGTCCRKGGPALHEEDAGLVMEKRIAPENLYTIRAGELVRDNVNGGLVYLDSEIIKIRSVPDSSACILYRETENACGIYDNRPAQCRALKCVDPAEIIGMHATNRLCRADLFGAVAWLRDLFEMHEAKCGYDYIRQLIVQRAEGKGEASRQLAKLISYDRTIRAMSVEKAGMQAGMLDLVFGMPLERVLQKRFGVKVETPDTP